MSGWRERASSTGAPLLALLVLTTALTWPWLFDPAGRIVGTPGGDNWGSMALWTMLGYCSSPFDSVVPCLAWPDGSGNSPGVQVASLLSTLFYWGGTELWGAVPSHGLMVFSGLLLTGVFGFLLVRKATGSAAAGLVAGVAFESTQHLVSMANAAAVYTHAWLTLLPLAAWWLVANRPTRRNALLAGLSIVPGAFWSPYTAEHTVIVWLACALVVLSDTWERNRQLVTRWAWALLPVGAVVVAGIAIRSAFSSDVPVRASGDAYAQALWPFLLLKPSKGSLVWGDGPNRVVASFMPSADEVGVYIGIVVLALAIIGVVLTFRRHPALSAREVLLGRLAVTTFVVCLLFAQVPRLAGAPMPAWLIQGFAPELRAGQRFMVPISGCAAILAGLAWTRIAPRRHVWHVAATVAVALAIAVDGNVRFAWSMGPAPEPSPALAALGRAPDGPVLHLPWGIENLRETSTPCLVRRYSQPLVNTCHREERSSVGQAVAITLRQDPCRGVTAASDAGVRYLVVDRVTQRTRTPLPVSGPVLRCLERLSASGRARRLASDPIREVWQLVPPSIG